MASGTINLTSFFSKQLSMTQGFTENDCIPAVGIDFEIFKVTNSSATGGDGYINAWHWDNNATHFISQLYIDVDPTWNMSLRSKKDNGDWTAWRRIVTDTFSGSISIGGQIISNITTSEAQVKVVGNAGTLYLYSETGASGARGLYALAHGTGGNKNIINVDTNNVITFEGRLNGSIYSTVANPSGRICFQSDQNSNSGYAQLKHHNSLSVGTNLASAGTGTGWTEIYIGNTTASGTAGNSQGWLLLYDSGSTNTQIAKVGTGNSNYFYIPNYSGNGYAITHTSTSALGSATQPVYVSAEGRVTACTTYANAEVLSAARLRNTDASENDCVPGAANCFQTFRCSSTSVSGGGDGYISTWRWNSGNYLTQLYVDVDNRYHMALRFRDNSSNWSAWKYIPMGDGTNASGTWGISISGNAATATTATTASKCSSAALTDIALTWSSSYSTGSWMLIYNGETGSNGGALFRAINQANTAAWVDGSHKWARIGGDTFTGPVRINGTDNASQDARLYIDHQSNNDWGIIINKSTSCDWGINVICKSDGSNGINCSGRITGNKVYGAVWNDYAECRNVNKIIEPGYAVYETKSKVMEKTYERLQPGCKVVSDTYGMCIGETEEAQTPIAICGRVLVYPYRDRNEYELGTAVCSAPNGTVDIMTREEIMMYPERIIGTVSEIPDYDTWLAGERDGNHIINVNGRIWIYVR